MSSQPSTSTISPKASSVIREDKENDIIAPSSPQGNADLELPLSVVSKIIKESLPHGVVVSKDARIAISRAASIFVLYWGF